MYPSKVSVDIATIFALEGSKHQIALTVDGEVVDKTTNRDKNKRVQNRTSMLYLFYLIQSAGYDNTLYMFNIAYDKLTIVDC